MDASGGLTRRSTAAIAHRVIAAVDVVPATQAGAATAPKNTALPTVSGTPAVDTTLSTTTGAWTGSPTPTSTYQ